MAASTLASSLMFQPLRPNTSGKIPSFPLTNGLSGDGNMSAINGSAAVESGNTSTTPGSITFPPSPEVITEPFCQWILYEDISNSRVRIWDLIILIPNSLFLMFLLWNVKISINKLRKTNSPIFTAFYIMVVLVSLISVLRCVVAMTVNATVLAGDITDKVLWLVLRFFLLATELSVIVFGIAFGHLDSRTSIQRVLVVTTTFAFAYSCTQGTLEFLQPDPNFRVDQGAVTKNYDIFAHGGMIFWMTSSGFFFLVYSIVFIMPWTSLRERLNLPSKKSFYRYALFLAILNCTQTVGSSLLYSGVFNGMCVVDATTYLYFTIFHPLVYGTFLREYFRPSSSDIPFSYKYQIDEGQDEDTVSLPDQVANNRKPDIDSVSDSGSFDSTHFVPYQGMSGTSINADVYIHSSIRNNLKSYQNA